MVDPALRIRIRMGLPLRVHAPVLGSRRSLICSMDSHTWARSALPVSSTRKWRPSEVVTISDIWRGIPYQLWRIIRHAAGYCKEKIKSMADNLCGFARLTLAALGHY